MQATEKSNLATKSKADVIISMLPLIDNFERASGQIKAETEQEQKIDAAYQVRAERQLPPDAACECSPSGITSSWLRG